MYKGNDVGPLSLFLQVFSVNLLSPPRDTLRDHQSVDSFLLDSSLVSGNVFISIAPIFFFFFFPFPSCNHVIDSVSPTKMFVQTNFFPPYIIDPCKDGVSRALVRPPRNPGDGTVCWKVYFLDFRESGIYSRYIF